jgi:hypothetical protein
MGYFAYHDIFEFLLLNFEFRQTLRLARRFEF